MKAFEQIFLVSTDQVSELFELLPSVYMSNGGPFGWFGYSDGPRGILCT